MLAPAGSLPAILLHNTAPYQQASRVGAVQNLR